MKNTISFSSRSPVDALGAETCLIILCFEKTSQSMQRQQQTLMTNVTLGNKTSDIRS